MNKFVFNTQNNKKNQVIVPEGYYRLEDSIVGIYTTNSIRFYVNNMEDKLTYEYILSKDPDISYEKIRKIQQFHHSAMDYFDIVNNYIRLKSSRTDQNKYFNFDKGIITVTNGYFMDVVEKAKLQTYLDNYGFDADEKEVLQSDVIEIPRTEGKALKFSLRH